MRHIYCSDPSSSDHYAVGTNGLGDVLVQLHEGNDQVRLKLSVEQARDMRDRLTHAIEEAAARGEDDDPPS